MPNDLSGETRSLLADVRAHIEHYVYLAPEQTTAVTLWVLHTHAFAAASATPYLVVFAPTQEHGKTRLLETVAAVTPPPLFASSITAAGLYQAIERRKAPVLIDEIDNALNPRSEIGRDLTAIVNGGNRPSGHVYRGTKDGQGREVSTFCPKVLCGIDNGSVASTTLSRSIVIRMRKLPPGRTVARFRESRVHEGVTPLRERLAAWGERAIAVLEGFSVDIPGVRDRAEDGWEPLVGIADLAGGEWPERVRSAAVSLSGEQARETPREERLLADIRRIFGEVGGDRMETAQLVQRLQGAEGWEQLTDSALGRTLGGFGVSRSRYRTPGMASHRSYGYLRSDLERVWVEYLGNEPAAPEIGDAVPDTIPDEWNTLALPDDVLESMEPPPDAQDTPLPDFS